MGNYARALELLSEGLEIATAIGDRWFAALCLNQQASITLRMDKPENAYERLQSAVAEWRAIGDPRFTAFGLNILSQSALTLGRYDEARAALEESVALIISIGDRWGLGSAYRGLGLVAQAQGEHLQAVDMFRKSLDTLTELGARQDVALGLAEMGRSIFVLGDDTQAGRLWRESLRIATETRGTHVALEALVGLANLQAKRGERGYALELLLIVLDHPASIQDTRNRAGQLKRELEAQLTSQQVEAAQARAGAKSLETIVDEILKQAELN
jgi:tetratricopeptide (TPR) repeat protein